MTILSTTQLHIMWTILISLLYVIGAAHGQGPGQAELDLITQRRRVDLAAFPTDANLASIPSWLSTQKSDGTWPDVNYATGCDAQRANWPIQQHWIRLITFASAWSGLNPSSSANNTDSAPLLAATKKGMDWWFANDFKSEDCVGSGGKDNGTCPCGTPGLWNTNWFGQVILIPQLASTACLLVADSGLSQAQADGCFRIPNRAYTRRDQFIPGLGYLTGANTINVMQNSVSMALFTNNATTLTDTLDRAMAVVTYSDKPKEDGIHRDGSFLQHDGILYSGNYGKDLLNAFIQLEGEAIGTSFAANSSTREAFATDIRGSEWMIYVDEKTKQEKWDLNAVGRFIAFPVSDLQANADINFNVSKLATATADFEGANDISATVRRLQSNGTEKLLGNKAFYAGDYMLHRRNSFVLGNKLLSNRSFTTEYTNTANPLGVHLGQGTLFSYVTGREYLDIQAAWDWNLIPGTTVLLGHPVLNSTNVGRAGKKTYVGVVSDGWVGTSVMDYVDSVDGSLSYRKAWFFLDDSVIVTTSALSVNTSVAGVSGRPVVSVLDNRASVGGSAWVDGVETRLSAQTKINGSTLYYGGNGYLSYGSPFSFTLSEGNRTGNWSAISTSIRGNTTVPIFSAYTTLNTNTSAISSYAFFPATSAERLASEAASPSSVVLSSNGTIAVAGLERLSVVFYPGSSTSITIPLATIGWSPAGSITLRSDQPAIYLFATKVNAAGQTVLVITLSDPSQSLDKLSFGMDVEGAGVGCLAASWDDGCSRTGKGLRFDVGMPRGGFAGDSVFREVILG